jgi:hypothetical protein
MTAAQIQDAYQAPAMFARGYETGFIPGLLQTPGYCRALLSHGTSSAHVAERWAGLRIRRQHLLRRPQPPRLWMLIDEAALRRVVGGRAVMADQLRHLLNACGTPGITIQVLTFRGRSPAAGVPVTMLRLPEPDLPDQVYLEHPAGAVYPARPGDLAWYLHMMNVLATTAGPADATPAILTRFLGDL